MIPQGSEILNLEYYVALNAQMNKARTCAELQALVNEALPSIAATKAAIEAEMAELLPMLALLSVPTDPTAVVTWVSNYISHILTPYLRPYTVYGAQLAALTSQIATLEALINTKASEFVACIIDIPPTP